MAGELDLGQGDEPGGVRSVCVRGREYVGVRVDVPKHAIALEYPALYTGPCGAVYRARVDGVIRALKRPRLPTSADLDRYHTELRLLAGLRHPNIVRLVAARAYPPDYSFVLPLYANGTLADLLHKQRWTPSWGAVLRHATELARGLEYVHSKGVVHRDIKPANVLVDEQWRVCVTDFGIAEEVSVLEQSLQNAIYSERDEDLEGRAVGAKAAFEARSQGGKPSGGFHKQHMVGTLEYLAPEVLRRQVGSYASDVYAFAITVCELATGVLPYSDRARNVALAHTVLDMSYNEQDLGAAIASENLRPVLPAENSGVPAGLVELVEGCWAGEAAARPSFSDAVGRLEALTLEVTGLAPDAVDAVWRAPPPKPPEVDPTAAAFLESLPPPAREPGWGSATAGAYVPVVKAAVFETCGGRGADKMEDRHALVSPIAEDTPQGHLFAVFDGHRGAECSEFACQSILPVLRSCWGRHASPHGALAEAFQSMDAAFVQLRADMEASGQLGSGLKKHPGATALAALVWDDRLFVANAGDCRAVLCRGGRAMPLSRDHTAGDAGEFERVKAAGGKLTQHAGTWRVGEAALAVTRGLGDADVKGDGLTSEPEVTETVLREDDEFVVLACDGVWDVLSNDDVVSMVQKTVKEPSMVAKRLATEAMNRGSTDNLTVIVAFLKPVSTVEKVWSSSAFK